MLTEYLRLIQEVARPTKMRERVEIFIVNADDKLIVGRKKNFDGKTFRIQTPGGGIEKGQTITTAAKTEALEELGVEIDNVKLLTNESYYMDWYALKDKGIHVGPKVEERMQKYRGARTRYVWSRFVKVNKRLYGKANDAMIPVILSIDDMIKTYKKQMHGFDPDLYKFRIRMAEALKKELRK